MKKRVTKGRRHKNRRTEKKLNIFLWVSVVAGIVVIAAVYMWRLRLATALGDIDVSIRDNELVILMEPTSKSDACRLYIYDKATRKFMPYGEYVGNMIILDDIADMAKMRFRLQAVKHIKIFGHRITLSGAVQELIVAPIMQADVESEEHYSSEDELSLEWEHIGDCRYAITWKPCQAKWYEVQQWAQKEECWESKSLFTEAEDMLYQTDRLPSGMEVCFRVVAYDNVSERDREEYKAVYPEASFHTDISPLYCTVWPIEPLSLLDEPQSGKSIDTIPAGHALCVLEERDEYFKVYYDRHVGFVDSSFCLINLPEFIGDLCEYEITGSIHSKTAVHGYSIPGITGNVIQGYENVCLGNGEYLVPYLYPCAQKLRKAIKAAADDGYHFRIYDAFRPNEATRYYYDTAEAVIDSPIDEDAASGATLREIMTDNGRYRLSSFLAASVSAHNRGIALDLTLVRTDTGEELRMQTDIHDLSAYSVISRNNDNAYLLADYMKGAGYNDLFSEWWHFQDDETKEEIGLSSYLKRGISCEGWKRDDAGWRYRFKDGGFCKDASKSIDGIEYSFDAEGYCVQDLQD